MEAIEEADALFPYLNIKNNCTTVIKEYNLYEEGLLVKSYICRMKNPINQVSIDLIIDESEKVIDNKNNTPIIIG